MTESSPVVTVGTISYFLASARAAGAFLLSRCLSSPTNGPGTRTLASPRSSCMARSRFILISKGISKAFVSRTTVGMAVTRLYRIR